MRLSEFNKNLMILLSGSIFGQAIPIAIMPILTRIYTPDDFGLVAVYLSLTMIFGSIANFRYELAIVLPEKDNDAIHIAALSIMISFFVSLFLLLIIVLFNNDILFFLKNDEIKIWLYILPISILSIGVFNAFNFLNTRQKKYRLLANTNIGKSLILTSGQLVFVCFKNIFNGLILSQVITNIAIAVFFIFKQMKVITSVRIDFNRILVLAIRYSKFPKYSMPAIFLNMLSTNLINILISSVFSLSTLGYYSLTQKMLGLPMTLIGNSIAQIYFQSASDMKNKIGNSWTIYKSTVIKLSIIAFSIFIPLFFIVKPLFFYIFGLDWEVAGIYAQYLIPFFCIRFIAVGVSHTNIIFEKQKIDLIWQLILLVINISLIFYAKYMSINFDSYIILLSFFCSLHYFCLILIMAKISKGNCK